MAGGRVRPRTATRAVLAAEQRPGPARTGASPRRRRSPPAPCDAPAAVQPASTQAAIRSRRRFAFPLQPWFPSRLPVLPASRLARRRNRRSGIGIRMPDRDGAAANGAACGTVGSSSHSASWKGCLRARWLPNRRDLCGCIRPASCLPHDGTHADGLDPDPPGPAGIPNAPAPAVPADRPCCRPAPHTARAEPAGPAAHVPLPERLRTR